MKALIKCYFKTISLAVLYKLFLLIQVLLLINKHTQPLCCNRKHRWNVVIM